MKTLYDPPDNTGNSEDILAGLRKETKSIFLLTRKMCRVTGRLIVEAERCAATFWVFTYFTNQVKLMKTQNPELTCSALWQSQWTMSTDFAIIKMGDLHAGLQIVFSNRFAAKFDTFRSSSQHISRGLREFTSFASDSTLFVCWRVRIQMNKQIMMFYNKKMCLNCISLCWKFIEGKTSNKHNLR